MLPIGILLVVAGVLIHGAFNRDGSVEAAPLTELEPPPTSQAVTRPDLEKTPLTYESDYWLQIARGTKPKFVLISSKNVPGVVVARDLVIAPIRAADELAFDRHARRLAEEHAAAGREKPPPIAAQPSEEAADPQQDSSSEEAERAEPYRLLAIDSYYGLALFELVNGAPEPFALVSPAGLAPGSFVAAITLQPDQRLRINPGYVASVAPGGAGNGEGLSLDVSFDVADVPEATAIVDLDGNLVGLTVRAEADARILPAPALLRLSADLRGQTPCQAIEAADVPEDVGKLLGISGGAFVEKVRQEAFVPEPSVRPGDVILRWEGRTVENASQFRELYATKEPGALARYVVLRGRQRLAGGTVLPGPDCRPLGSPPLALLRTGALLEWQDGPSDDTEMVAGWRVRHVLESSLAAEGGLQPDDWVVAVNGRDLTRDNAESSFATFEARGRSLALTVRRGDRVKLVLIQHRKQTS